jgi:ribonuclease HII
MAWIVGIDEAGYGPNLGPFVMSAVACRVPDTAGDGDLWKTLRPAVRRHGEADDGRLLIADSKLVYSTARGLPGLEAGVLALLGGASARAGTLADLLGCVCPAAKDDLAGECWYTGTTPLPVEVTADALAAGAERLAWTSAAAGLTWGLVRSVVVCPLRFNAVLDRWGSKGVVLGLGLAELLGDAREPAGDAEPVSYVIDKHGGRNCYAPMLQQALPDGLVVVEEEGRERSVYRVAGLPRPVRLTIAPRADSAHLCVALASMVSKYLRELFMMEFNRFWQAHQPGLRPTAGYPGDAARFFADIGTAVRRLGLAADAVWRRK